MSLLNELKKRKIINNITNEKKAKKFFDNKGSVYVGFDPSFHSLHVGNLIMIILLRRFNNEGFKTYAILGGATGMIGDPSGKQSERNLLSEETLKNNIIGVSKQLKKYTNSEVINNYDFYKDSNVLDFLRDVGKYININYMLEKDIIKNRLETGISYTEFSYSILQAYDFYILWRDKNINLQMGGSDQWSNITSGIDLIKKFDLNNDAFGITINLLTKKDGTKFGKSEKGAIYLDSEISSPYEMYQFFYNQSDEDIEKIVNFFSLKKLDEIEEIINSHKKNTKLRIAQKEISYEIVCFIHGKDAAENVIKMNELIFNKKFNDLSKLQFDMIAIKNITSEIKEEKIKILDAIVLTNICESKSQAKNLVSQKSIRINGNDIQDINFELTKKDSYYKKYTIVQKGKKNFKILKWI
ncbi:MAG: tyrosine--tRNA ligase [Mycoplasmoidaceae bacterium]